MGHELAVKMVFQTLLMELTPTGWIFIPEYTLANGKRPDGALRDNFTILRGYWEAKDTRDDLDLEVRKKLAAGIRPTTSSSRTPPTRTCIRMVASSRSSTSSTPKPWPTC